jgi:alpha-tubulin suppressor-like RCC1 family protein
MDNVQSVSAGFLYTMAVLNGGSLLTWGRNNAGQLGIGETPDMPLLSVRVPREVVGVSDVAHVSAGAHHTVITQTNGNVWSWGSNSHNQLGIDANVEMRFTPARIIG